MDKKLRFERSFILLIISSVTMLPVAVSLIFNMSAYFTYAIIISCCTVCIALTTMVTIQALTYVQAVTPSYLIGKVISCVMAICMCAQPYWIILGATVICTVLSIRTKGIFKGIENEGSIETLEIKNTVQEC